MQLAAVALLVLAAAIRAEDECTPKPGQMFVHAQECCKMDYVATDSVMDAWKTCKDKFPKPSGPPPAPGAKPDAAMVNRVACMVECVFAEVKMVNGDKKLDKDVITTIYTASIAADMKPVMTAAIDKCVAVEVDPSLECKSGALDFRRCLGREAFLNCPSTLWTSSGDCDGVKSQLTKCPMIPVMFAKSMGTTPN